MKKVNKQEIELTLSNLDNQNIDAIMAMCKYTKRKFPDTAIVLRCNVIWEYVKNSPLMEYIDYLIINHTIEKMALNDETKINVKESLKTGVKVLR